MTESSDHPEHELPQGLGELWRQQETPMTIADPGQLITSLKQQQRSERRRIFRLNVQEVLPSVVLAGGLTVAGLSQDAGRWPLLAAAAISLAVGLFLVGSTLRQRSKENGFDQSIRGELGRSLSQAEHRYWLYSSIAWWYLAPVAAVITLIVLSVKLSVGTALLFDVIYGISVVALFAVLYRLNRRVATDRYLPEVERYRDLLANLDSDPSTGDFGQDHRK